MKKGRSTRPFFISVDMGTSLSWTARLLEGIIQGTAGMAMTVCAAASGMMSVTGSGSIVVGACVACIADLCRTASVVGSGAEGAKRCRHQRCGCADSILRILCHLSVDHEDVGVAMTVMAVPAPLPAVIAGMLDPMVHGAYFPGPVLQHASYRYSCRAVFMAVHADPILAPSGIILISQPEGVRTNIMRYRRIVAVFAGHRSGKTCSGIAGNVGPRSLAMAGHIPFPAYLHPGGSSIIPEWSSGQGRKAFRIRWPTMTVLTADRGSPDRTVSSMAGNIGTGSATCSKYVSERCGSTLGHVIAPVHMIGS